MWDDMDIEKRGRIRNYRKLGPSVLHSDGVVRRMLDVYLTLLFCNIDRLNIFGRDSDCGL